MNDLEIVRNWMDEPLPVHEFTADDVELRVGTQTEVHANFDNVTYVHTEEYARPVYEEDMGEVTPSHYDVYKNGMDWSFEGHFVSITGSVEGIPCEAFWSLDRVEVRR